MSRHFDDVGDAAFKSGCSFLSLWIAPLLASFLGLLSALVSPVHGLFEGIHKILEVWIETKEVQQGIQGGTLLVELRTNYTVALYFGIIVVSLFLTVAALSFISRLFTGRWAAAVETTAAAIWLIP